MDPDLVLENVKLDCQAAWSSPEATTSLKHGKKLAKMMMSHASSFQLASPWDRRSSSIARRVPGVDKVCTHTAPILWKKPSVKSTRLKKGHSTLSASAKGNWRYNTTCGWLWHDLPQYCWDWKPYIIECHNWGQQSGHELQARHRGWRHSYHRASLPSIKGCTPTNTNQGPPWRLTTQ